MNNTTKKKWIATLAALAAMGLILLIAAMTLFSWPVGLNLRSAKDIPWLPPSANVIAFRDTHGGLHGDGETYLVFTATAADVARAVSQLSRIDIDWKVQPIDTTAERTIDSISRNLNVPDNSRPRLGTESYLIGHSPETHGLYYRLIVIDTNNNKCWFWELTT